MKQCSWCAGDIQESETACRRCSRPADAESSERGWDDEEVARHAALAIEGSAAPAAEAAPRSGAASVPAQPPAGPRGPEPPHGLSRVELFIVLLAILAGGTVTFGVLMARGAAPQAAAAIPETGPTIDAAGLIAPPQTPASPKWSHANRARWVANPRRDIAFELPAENRVQAWMKQVEPILVVRCVGRRTEAFVYTETPAKIEARDEDHTVAIAFDAEPQSTERWPDSAEHDALFAPDGEAFARRLMTAQSLRFGFTPHNAPPVTVQFTVAGLSALLEPAARQCGWKK